MRLTANKNGCAESGGGASVPCQTPWRRVGDPRRSAGSALLTVDRACTDDHDRLVKVREVLERLHREGWKLARQRGSHRQFVHPDYQGRRVTVAGHPRLDVPKGTLNSIFKQAGWK